jgi:hypothetical protein
VGRVSFLERFLLASGREWNLTVDQQRLPSPAQRLDQCHGGYQLLAAEFHDGPLKAEDEVLRGMNRIVCYPSLRFIPCQYRSTMDRCSQQNRSSTQGGHTRREVLVAGILANIFLNSLSLCEAFWPAIDKNYLSGRRVAISCDYRIHIVSSISTLLPVHANWLQTRFAIR